MSQQKKHSLQKVHLDNTTLKEKNEKIGCSKSVQPSTVNNYIYNTDWLWAPYFLNYFGSEMFYWDEPLKKNIFFVETQRKCYIFKIGELSRDFSNSHKYPGS